MTRGSAAFRQHSHGLHWQYAGFEQLVPNRHLAAQRDFHSQGYPGSERLVPNFPPTHHEATLPSFCSFGPFAPRAHAASCPRDPAPLVLRRPPVLAGLASRSRPGLASQILAICQGVFGGLVVKAARAVVQHVHEVEQLVQFPEHDGRTAEE